MRALILIFILLSTRVVIFAQNPIDPVGSRPLNSIYINLLGDASLISFNYERKFLISQTFLISSKLGLGYNEEFSLNICIWGPCPPPPAPKKYLTIPHHITGILGKGLHFFEFGLGGTIISGVTTQPYLFYPIVGYRILPLMSNKINFRVFGQIPFSGLETDDILFIPFGLSLGVSF